MPPHCDSLDGPVVNAARAALAANDVALVLPYVHADAEDEIRQAFESTREVRRLGPAAQTLADLAFFETVVRVHRAGEGAPYTGLKPAGLDIGPVIPKAEQAAATLDAAGLIACLNAEVQQQIQHRIDQLRTLASKRSSSLADERAYVEAVLGLQVYSHHLWKYMRTEHGH